MLGRQQFCCTAKPRKTGNFPPYGRAGGGYQRHHERTSKIADDYLPSASQIKKRLHTSSPSQVCINILVQFSFCYVDSAVLRSHAPFLKLLQHRSQQPDRLAPVIFRRCHCLNAHWVPFLKGDPIQFLKVSQWPVSSKVYNLIVYVPPFRSRSRP